MPWHARLQLDYARAGARTVARFAHAGPLRVLHSLYPEGPGICHNVLLHPPGGLVGGDTLDIALHAGSGAHALITTPGATRCYRSSGAIALQRTRLVLAAGARIEWLPQETLCYSGCQAENRLTLELAPGAECLGWELCALGLPHSGQPFVAGRYVQHIEAPGLWLERGVLDAADQRLLHGPVGLAGQACLASLFFLAGSALHETRRETALDAARSVLAAHARQTCAGATSPNGQLLLLRALAPQVEPAMQLLRQARAAWRAALWQLAAEPPRIWAL